MPRPATIPTWATNPAFASPGDTWDGDPTRVAPPTGKRAEGFEPTETPPAEYFNWLFGLLGDWAAHLAPVPVDNVFPIDMAVSPDGRIVAVAYAPLARSGRGVHVAVVNTNGAIGSALFGDGETWSLATSLPGSPDDLWDVATDGAATFVLVGGDASTGEKVYTSSDGQNWTARATVAAAGNRFRAAVYNVAFGRWIVAGDNGHIETSADGITWVERTPPFADGFTDVLDLAVDPATGIVVAVTADTGGGSQTWRSTDGGLTWSQVAIDAFPLRGVAWSPGGARFVAVGGPAAVGPARVRLSGDGTSWSDAAAVPGISAAQLDSVACDGGSVLLATGSAVTFSFYAYSMDGGDNWSKGRARDSVTQPVRRVSYADGRFYVMPGTTSGVDKRIWKTLRTG